jgi:aspartokinase/homoserine dehydrogenase 1
MLNAVEFEVHKFGGTSLGTAERIGSAAALVNSERSASRATLVVASAMGGVTDRILRAVESALARSGEHDALLDAIEQQHVVACAGNGSALRHVRETMTVMRELVHGVYLLRECTPRTRDAVSCMGELLSSPLLAAQLGCEWIDSRLVVRTNDKFGDAQPLLAETRELLLARIGQMRPGEIVVVSGFAGSTADGLTTTLGRSGSDFSATIVAACVRATRVVIWTDVDGVMTADPRIVPDARSIPSMSYIEANELAFFGGKVLHPRTMLPVWRERVPVEIRNTMNPGGAWTKICDVPAPTKAVSSVTNCSIVMIEGPGMRGVVGIAARVFNALSRGNVSAKMIAQASSESAICLVLEGTDVPVALKNVRAEFELELAAGVVNEVSSIDDLAIVALVGEGMRHSIGVAGKLMTSLAHASVSVIAISQAASETNISCVVTKRDIAPALNAVHQSFCLERRRIHVVVVGLGVVGGALLRMIGALQSPDAELVLVGAATTRRMAWKVARGGLPWTLTPADLTEPASLEALVERCVGAQLLNLVVVDATASDALPLLYERLLTRGVAVVTPNKRAGVLPMARFAPLRRLSARFAYEATVMAGLPVISTLKDLLRTGDRVRSISGVFSGTLAFVFSRLGAGDSFSVAVTKARQLGYTEPDPREDLNGMDVARKVLILARECGSQLELADVRVESLVPASLAGASVDLFMGGLAAYDDEWQRRADAAAAAGGRLAFEARFDAAANTCVVGPVVSHNANYAAIGTDNIILFETDRYSQRPLIVQGPGAGPDVTAAGILGDVLRLTSGF